MIDVATARAQLDRILNHQAPSPTDRNDLAVLMHVASTQQFVRLHGCVIDDHGTAGGEEIWEAARARYVDTVAGR